MLLKTLGWEPDDFVLEDQRRRPNIEDNFSSLICGTESPRHKENICIFWLFLAESVQIPVSPFSVVIVEEASVIDSGFWNWKYVFLNDDAVKSDKIDVPLSSNNSIKWKDPDNSSIYLLGIKI